MTKGYKHYRPYEKIAFLARLIQNGEHRVVMQVGNPNSELQILSSQATKLSMMLHKQLTSPVHVAAFGTHREAVFVAEGSMDDRPTAGDPEEDSSTG